MPEQSSIVIYSFFLFLANYVIFAFFLSTSWFFHSLGALLIVTIYYMIYLYYSLDITFNQPMNAFFTLALFVLLTLVKYKMSRDETENFILKRELAELNKQQVGILNSINQASIIVSDPKRIREKIASRERSEKLQSGDHMS